MPAKPTSNSRPVVVRAAVNSVLLVWECFVKRSAFRDVGSRLLPEDMRSVLSRMLFIWINPILSRGYRNMLLPQDVPPLSEDMKSEHTRTTMLQAWSRRALPETKKTLPLALFKCLQMPFLAAAIPRLFLIGFRYAQPALIKQSIKFAMDDSEASENHTGFWLIVSSLIIYIGLALSTAKYQHSLNRLKLMTRTALVGIIYNKTLELPSVSYDTGEATTLMSTDTDGLETIAEMVHEIWAQVLEVLIGIGLLADQIGWIWPLPLFLIYLSSHMSRFVAKHLQPRQKAWNVATQDRIAATSDMLASIKIIKMLGFQYDITRRIQTLRNTELYKAAGLRLVMLYYGITANALGIFSPAITLVLFAVISQASGRALQTDTAFTTMAILSMITNPANMVMTIVPRTIAAFSGFERIQAFLLQQPLQTYRGTLSRGNAHPVMWDPSSGRLAKPGPAIQIRDVAIGSKGVPLKNINIELAANSFTILSGPTGSGKSSLLRSLIGEVLPSHGSISLSSHRIAYCAQRPWLPNGTIRNAIRGFANMNDPISPWSQQWYDKVIEICCLTQDLAALYNGDQTQIGSRGLNLSGGQRQRVALARALFARCDILLLDDTFSGLDGDTERTIFDNLFKSTGLLRQQKTTVILVSNSSQYFEAADHVVVLGNNSIVEQGPWRTIKLKSQTLAKFSAGTQQPVEDAKLAGRYDALNAQIRVKEETEADLSRQTGDPAIYGYYLRFIGLVNILSIVIFTASYSFFITFPQYWLQLWTERQYNRSDSFYIIGFLLLSLLSWLSTSGQMWSNFTRLAPESGMRLHRHLLSIVTNAPLSFFSATENGSILNRFTQDIQLIDKQLPTAFVTLITQIFKLLMQVILLCIVEKWLALSLPACVAIVYVIQKVYLRTSRQLRFLELEARAGVFSSFLETIEGLETIRTFGWSGDVTRENIDKVDESSRPEFLLLCLQRWLNIVLDLLAAAIATTVVVTAVAFKGHVSGAEIGVALNTMLVTNTTLLRLVESWALLETSLGAIARVKTLENMTPFEGGRVPGLDPAPDWPQKGHIKLKQVTAAYQNENVALKALNLDIPAGQKLVVCGRTGSGKSTLLLTMLRILELRSGSIEIDGFDIKHVSLEVLRQRCFITVSQDPLLLLHETVRFNLDPSASIPNEVLMEALRKCELSSHFSRGQTTDPTEGRSSFEQTDIDKYEGPNGEHPILDQKLLEFSELSVGQCQLFALSRALVKAILLERYGIKPIVLLDEATSSLDSVTEATIYRIIDEEFSSKGHTAVIVAHRVGVLEKHMKKGRDAVAVMGDGRLQDVSTNWEKAALG
ncbi:putative ABC transporter [Xylaria bambusicola]|uniref:putative ABC transporter n=1 Tax=Xylaria bambusicola TaxID=326684 RepID=UPI002008AC2B|nr:putative ABC transporter [Xylaria bambusicola]KAI0521679.1 putative ABC transporter [Xylaria bambusicola]